MDSDTQVPSEPGTQIERFLFSSHPIACTPPALLSPTGTDRGPPGVRTEEEEEVRDDSRTTIGRHSRVLGPLTSSSLQRANVALTARTDTLPLLHAPWHQPHHGAFTSSSLSLSPSRIPATSCDPPQPLSPVGRHVDGDHATTAITTTVTSQAAHALRPLQRLAALPPCWICLSSHTEERLVWDRCLCSEMTARVHVSCLHEWVLVRGHTHCPVCGARYHVEPATNLEEYTHGCPSAAILQPWSQKRLRALRTPANSPTTTVTRGTRRQSLTNASDERDDALAPSPAACPSAVASCHRFSPLRWLAPASTSRPGLEHVSAVVVDSAREYAEAGRAREWPTHDVAEATPGMNPHDVDAVTPSLRELAATPVTALSPASLTEKGTARSTPSHGDAPRHEARISRMHEGEKVARQYLPLWLRVPLIMYHVVACVTIAVRVFVQLLWLLFGDVLCAWLLLSISSQSTLALALHLVHACVPAARLPLRLDTVFSRTGWRSAAVSIWHGLDRTLRVLVLREDDPTASRQWWSLVCATAAVRVVRLAEGYAWTRFATAIVWVKGDAHGPQATDDDHTHARDPLTSTESHALTCTRRRATATALSSESHSERSAGRVASVVMRRTWRAMRDTASFYRLLLPWLRVVHHVLHHTSHADRDGRWWWWCWSLRSLMTALLLHRATANATLAEVQSREHVRRSLLVFWLTMTRTVMGILFSCWYAVTELSQRRPLVAAAAATLIVSSLGALLLAVLRHQRRRTCEHARSRGAHRVSSVTHVGSLVLETDTALRASRVTAGASTTSSPRQTSTEAAPLSGRRRRRALEHQRRARYGACRTVVVVRGAGYAFVQREVVRAVHVVLCPWLVGVCVQAVTSCAVDWSLPLWGGSPTVVWASSRLCAALPPLSRTACVALTPSLDVLSVCGHWLAGACVLWCATRLIVGPALGSVVAPRVMQDWMGLIQAHPLDVAGVDACVTAHWVRGNVRRERSGGGGARAWLLDTLVHVLPRELWRVWCRTAVCCVLLGVPSCVLWWGRALFARVVPVAAQYDSTQPLPLWTLGGRGGDLAAHAAAWHATPVIDVAASLQAAMVGTTAPARVLIPGVAFVLACVVRLRAILWAAAVQVNTCVGYRLSVFGHTRHATPSAQTPSSGPSRVRWSSHTAPSPPRPPQLPAGFLARLLSTLRRWWYSRTRPTRETGLQQPSSLFPSAPSPQTASFRWLPRLSLTWLPHLSWRAHMRRLRGLACPANIRTLRRSCHSQVVGAWQYIANSTSERRLTVLTCVLVVASLCWLLRRLQRWLWRCVWPSYQHAGAELLCLCGSDARARHYTRDTGVRTHASWWEACRLLSFAGVLGTRPVPLEEAVRGVDRGCGAPASLCYRTAAEVEAVRRDAKQKRQRQRWHLRHLERQERESRRLAAARTGIGLSGLDARGRARAPPRPRWQRRCRRTAANAWRRVRLLCFLVSCVVGLSLVCFGPVVCVMTLLADVVPHGALLLLVSIAICDAHRAPQHIRRTFHAIAVSLRVGLMSIRELTVGVWYMCWLPWHGDALTLSVLPMRWVVAAYPSAHTSSFHADRSHSPRSQVAAVWDTEEYSW